MILHKLKYFYPSELLLMINTSQPAHKKLDSYCKNFVLTFYHVFNFCNYSTLKEQWKFNRPDLLPSSVIHHGRALLNYQGDEDGSNIDKPLVFGPVVNKFHDRQTVDKVDPSVLNTSQKKSSPLKSRDAERRDLMVIKNKWDFLGDSRQKRRQVKRKERNPKSRRKIGINPQNGTLDDQFYCPSYFNKTEATRYFTRKKYQAMQKLMMKEIGNELKH